MMLGFSILKNPIKITMYPRCDVGIDIMASMRRFNTNDKVCKVIPPYIQWRHNDHDGVSNHQPHGCLLNRLFRRRSKKTSKLRVTGLCAGNSPGPVNSPHKGPVTRKMSPFDDVIMSQYMMECESLQPLIYRSLIWYFISSLKSTLSSNAIPTCQPKMSHYNGDVILGAISSQITSFTIVYSTVYSGTDQRKHQSSASLPFVREIHRSSVISLHKCLVTRKMFPFDDVIMTVAAKLDIDLFHPIWAHVSLLSPNTTVGTVAINR